MAKLVEVADKPGYYIFQCPGCGSCHFVNTNPEYGAVWNFNNNLDKPTVTPSLLVRWDWGQDKIHHVCHSFIKEGMIQFLGDCTHELASKTIEIPEW